MLTTCNSVNSCLKQEDGDVSGINGSWISEQRKPHFGPAQNPVPKGGPKQNFPKCVPFF